MAPLVKSSETRSNKSYSTSGYNAKKRPAANGDDGKKSFMDQKLAKKQRKMQRPHYEMVTRAKEIWNVIRENKVDKNKRATLVDELFLLVKGKIHDVAAKHDASRVIQSLMQYGRPEHRSQIVLEMKDHLIEAAKMQYGCFLVQKMICYGSAADRAVIVKCLTGHVVQVGTHNIAANVLEYAQEFLKPSQLTALRLEFYGREFAYFRSESKHNLADIIAAHPEKKADVLQHLSSILNRMVDKQLLGLAFVQSLLWEYLCNAEYDYVMLMVGNVRDAALALLATRNGARVVNMCISLGTAKDRKRIIKTLKDKVLDACNHPSGYLVIMRILDVVDDSVLVQKSILAEMNDALFSIAMHPGGRKVLLQLLSPLNTKYLSLDDLTLLEPPMLRSPEDSTVMIVNYKKDPDARRRELLKGLLPKLEEMCIANVADLMRSKEGRDVIVEVAKHSESTELADSVIAAVLAEEAEPLYTDANGHFALRRLIMETRMTEPLLTAVAKQLSNWATSNRGSFVVLAFLEAERAPKNVTDVVKKALEPAMSELKKLADTQKGTELLLEKLG
uniref:PUM-HD domain-containing protein n=1 Tax=Peronospora matthiolae TaxID=2874970 RepID=A0AAV1T370_9STRA